MVSQVHPSHSLLPWAETCGLWIRSPALVLMGLCFHSCKWDLKRHYVLHITNKGLIFCFIKLRKQLLFIHCSFCPGTCQLFCPIEIKSSHPQDRFYYYHFTDKKTKAQRDEVTCPRSCAACSQDLNPGLSDSKGILFHSESTKDCV